MPQTSPTVRGFQKAILQTASELRALDRRLARIADSIEPEAGRLLPSELRGGAHSVRFDLLRDAIETLSALGHATEEGVLEKRLEVGDTADRIAAFG